MRLVTYVARSDAPRLGVVVDSLVVDVERFGDARGLNMPNDMLSFIDHHVTLQPALATGLQAAAAVFPSGSALPIGDVRLLAPIPRPRKNIFGVGLNYREHVAESAKSLDTDKDLPKQPVLFSKPPTAVIGPGDAIHHNGKMTQQLDWEVELAVIIGKTATRILQGDAMKHVFGYSVMIDVSARDNRRAGQWIFSKGMDTYAPFGPCIVTADDVENPHDLRLWLTKNGVTKQDSNTKYLIFDISTLIADIASGITLEPGDIIATGTPAGVGAGLSPQEWMWPGDVIECGVDGIGTLRHPVVAI